LTDRENGDDHGEIGGNRVAAATPEQHEAALKLLRG